MFADDYTMTESGTVQEIQEKLQADVEELLQWAAENDLMVEPTKSSLTLFTPWMSQREINPVVSINGVPLKLEKQVKILGIILSRHGCFTAHVDEIIKICQSRIQILRALAGSTWGCRKEIIIMTYKALILPLISYACTIWYPNICHTKIEALQRIQDSALRIATGCHVKSARSHLHAECKLLTVKQNLDML